MGLFSKLTKLVINTALLPVDVVADIVTLGGELTDSNSYTGKRIEKIGDTIDELDED
jgi:hypothetical protein